MVMVLSYTGSWYAKPYTHHSYQYDPRRYYNASQTGKYVVVEDETCENYGFKELTLGGCQNASSLIAGLLLPTDDFYGSGVDLEVYTTTRNYQPTGCYRISNGHYMEVSSGVSVFVFKQTYFNNYSGVPLDTGTCSSYGQCYCEYVAKKKKGGGGEEDLCGIYYGRFTVPLSALCFVLFFWLVKYNILVPRALEVVNEHILENLVETCGTVVASNIEKITTTSSGSNGSTSTSTTYIYHLHVQYNCETAMVRCFIICLLLLRPSPRQKLTDLPASPGLFAALDSERLLRCPKHLQCTPNARISHARELLRPARRPASRLARRVQTRLRRQAGLDLNHSIRPIFSCRHNFNAERLLTSWLLHGMVGVPHWHAASGRVLLRMVESAQF